MDSAWTNVLGNGNHRRFCTRRYRSSHGLHGPARVSVDHGDDLGFRIAVWLPALFANPHSFGNWSEGVETLAIAASAWIVADFLGRSRSAQSAPASLG